jgi:MFS family permease
MFLSLLDTSIVATALYTIGSDFSGLDRVTWVALAYTLAYLGFAVPFAALADVLGRRTTYNVAFVLFLAFSLGCGWAQSLNQLIVFRTFQGIGGAGLYSLTMVIFPEITPPHLNNLIGALAGMVVAVSGVAGPVLGGVITRYSTWRWVFWINGPVVLVAMVVFNFSWPRPDQLQGVQTRRKWKELDFVGSVLIIAASVLTVYAFQHAGINTDSWTQATFLAPLLTGCLCWTLLFLWQWAVHRWWRDRVAAVVPWHLLQQRVYIAGAAFTLLMGFPYFFVIYNLPLRFQVVDMATPLYAGIWLLPMLGSAAVGSTIGGTVNSKKNHVTATFVAGSIFLTLGMGLMTTFDLSTNLEAKTFGFEVFVGLGFGLSVATASLSTALEASLRDAGMSPPHHLAFAITNTQASRGPGHSLTGPGSRRQLGDSSKHRDLRLYAAKRACRRGVAGPTLQLAVLA